MRLQHGLGQVSAGYSSLEQGLEQVSAGDSNVKGALGMIV